MIEKLLKKYWSKKSSLEEKKNLLEALDNQDIISSAILEALPDDEEESTIKKETANRILARIHQQIKSEKSYHKTTFWAKISAAAAVTLLVVFVFLDRNEKKTAELALDQWDTIANKTPDRLVNIVLADKTNILLYPHSQVVYTQTYNKENRKVFLEGKAKFKVTKNTKLPFSVSSKNFTTTALGTEFIVTENLIKKQATVDLLEGKVRIESSTKASFETVYLKAGEQFFWDIAKQKSRIIEPLNVASKKLITKNLPSVKEKKTIAKSVEIIDLSDEKQELIFDKTPLKEVFYRLEEYHQTKIQLGNIPDGLTFTARFDSSEELYKILDIICELNDLQYQIQNQQIYIEKK